MLCCVCQNLWKSFRQLNLVFQEAQFIHQRLLNKLDILFRPYDQNTFVSVFEMKSIFFVFNLFIIDMVDRFPSFGILAQSERMRDAISFLWNSKLFVKESIDVKFNCLLVFIRFFFLNEDLIERMIAFSLGIDIIRNVSLVGVHFNSNNITTFNLLRVAHKWILKHGDKINLYFLPLVRQIHISFPSSNNFFNPFFPFLWKSISNYHLWVYLNSRQYNCRNLII